MGGRANGCRPPGRIRARRGVPGGSLPPCRCGAATTWRGSDRRPATARSPGSGRARSAAPAAQADEPGSALEVHTRERAAPMTSLHRSLSSWSTSCRQIAVTTARGPVVQHRPQRTRPARGRTEIVALLPSPSVARRKLLGARRLSLAQEHAVLTGAVLLLSCAVIALVGSPLRAALTAGAVIVVLGGAAVFLKPGR